jgi:hypothetical protein|tara:strand:- start:233 stop:544 length:312 start_codon:yes stop_codon:yes gene_type:complete
MQRIGDYVKVVRKYSDKEKHEAAITFLKEKGKRNPVPYGDGCIVVHHKGLYYFINTITYKWCNRHKAHIKWKKANSMEEVWEGMTKNSESYNRFKKLREEQKA